MSELGHDGHLRKSRGRQAPKKTAPSCNIPQHTKTCRDDTFRCSPVPGSKKSGRGASHRSMPLQIIATHPTCRTEAYHIKAWPTKPPTTATYRDIPQPSTTNHQTWRDTATYRNIPQHTVGETIIRHAAKQRNTPRYNKAKKEMHGERADMDTTKETEKINIKNEG